MLLQRYGTQRALRSRTCPLLVSRTPRDLEHTQQGHVCGLTLSQCSSEGLTLSHRSCRSGVLALLTSRPMQFRRLNIESMQLPEVLGGHKVMAYPCLLQRGPAQMLDAAATDLCSKLWNT